MKSKDLRGAPFLHGSVNTRTIAFAKVIKGKRPSSEGDARMSNTYERLYSTEMIDRAYKKEMAGKKKYRKEAVIFNMMAEINLYNLRKELKYKTYEPGEFKQMIVREPKERIINYPVLRDKIVQYACHELLMELYSPVYIRDSYANQTGKGTHDAVYRIQHNMRYVKWKYGDAWIMKLDIRKFYYNIDREVTKELLRKKITPDEKDFLDLLCKIIDHSPEKDGKGLPLGNVSSQDLANVIGNQIDQYATRYKHWKHYVRFADDVIAVFPTREEAKASMQDLKGFIKEQLHLETNEKTRIFPVDQGVKALGYRIYTTHMLLQDYTIKHEKMRIAAIDEKVKSGQMTEKEAQHQTDSWLGHARVANSYKLCEKIFKHYPYIKYEREDWRFGEKSPKMKEKIYGKRNNSQAGNIDRQRNTVCNANQPG